MNQVQLYTRERKLLRAFKEKYPNQYDELKDRVLIAADTRIETAYNKLPDTKQAAKEICRTGFNRVFAKHKH